MTARMRDDDGPWTLVDREDLGRGGFVFEWRSRRHPRLAKRLFRRNLTSGDRVTWLVDGVRCADRVEAMALLARPPVPADRFERSESAGAGA